MHENLKLDLQQQIEGTLTPKGLEMLLALHIFDFIMMYFSMKLEFLSFAHEVQLQCSA